MLFRGKTILASVGMLLLLGLAAFFLASCNHDGGGDDTSTGSQLAAPALKLGLLSPTSGSFGYLAQEPLESAMLAISDINAAGGNVSISHKDTGTNVDMALGAAREFINDDVNAIVGAYSSLVSLGIVEEVIASNTVMFSPASSSPRFSVLEEDNEHNLFFRTVASNELWAIVVAAEIQANGAENVAIVYRDDGFGSSISGNTMRNLQAAGINVSLFRGYDPTNPDTDAIVDEIIAANVDSLFLVAFAEIAEIVGSVLERTTDLKFYVSSAAVRLGELVDPENPAVVSGIINIDTAPHPDAITELVSSLSDHEEPFTGTTYDAVVIIALAAFAAQSNDPLVFSREINDITRGGTKCMSYAQCQTLLRAGENIDYDGAGGPLEFSNAGEPVFSAYRVYAYDSAGDPTPGRVFVSPTDFIP